MRTLAALLAALTVLIPAPGNSRGARSGAVSIHTVVAGLRLTVTTGQRTYPLDALVKVTLRAKNVSSHVITLDGAAILPNGGNPSVRDVDDSGAPVPMPSQFMDYPIIPPSPPTRVAVAPGQTVSRTLTVILWAPHLQASVSTEAGFVQSASLNLNLVAADPPPVTVDSTDGNLTAEVQRPPGFGGPLLYRSSVFCPINDTTAGISAVMNEVPAEASVLDTWKRTTATTFTPPLCPAPAHSTSFSGWRLIVGWPNHSVAAVDYGGPAP